jgi:hypothetical protein
MAAPHLGVKQAPEFLKNMLIDRVEKVVGLAGAAMLARIWVRFRRNLSERRNYKRPIFDLVALEVAMTPRSEDGDDPDVLAEMRDTLAHLNRGSFAQEFAELDKQLVLYYQRLPASSAPTMRQGMLRLLACDDRWLRLLAARTCAGLPMPEAVPVLHRLLDEMDTTTEADASYARELERSLAALQAPKSD